MRKEMNTNEKRNSVKKFFKTHFAANPLSYLGWLGMLGIAGLFMAPMFIPFLLCFQFFSYAGMKPDELFWRNVNKASARAFWSVFIMDAVVVGIMFIMAMAVDRSSAWIQANVQENSVSMGAYIYYQYEIGHLTFIGNIVLMILVFTISMMRFKKQEKKMLESADTEK